MNVEQHEQQLAAERAAREKAEADMKKLYRRAMAYTARKRHLRESQKLW